MAKILKLMSNDLDSSLNYYIRNGFQPHPHYYNCTGTEDPYAIGEKRQFLGVYFMTFGVMILSIYLPCLFVISHSDLMKSSCYKIMLYLGIMDTCCLTVNSLATGFLGFIGATFCSFPRFIFLAGAVGCGCWMGSCATCIMLAINRCSDINHNLPFRRMFVGKNVYYTMLIPVVYTIYAVFFTKPIIFNSVYMSWFFNPMLGLEVFIQSILICSCNATAAFIYVYMQFFHSPPPVILLGQIAWQCAHASVCVVYITWNRTIRRKVMKLLIPKRFRNKVGTSTTFTVARPIMNLMDLTKTTRTNSGTVF
ncbi:hypothetical protein CAEBREN_04421 [Caenorhabditis brenneri]|uniref:Uncharacterized protein n=1 Tax=Caenorhabditis brenneri TaxID=135651 RepID=G0PGL9_CAEBE|nr:hypothetical protein CAEBREN_04421 [Caenorhabditis brenneri]